MNRSAKKAFTMIELVFVIVILGILAAVAIPKISATRTDAEVSKLAHNIMTGASEIATYAVSQAGVDSNFSVMSNAMHAMDEQGDATLSANRADIKAGTVSNCVVVTVTTDATTGVDTLNITFNNDNGDSKCQALQRVIDPTDYPMKLRGTNVKY